MTNPTKQWRYSRLKRAAVLLAAAFGFATASNATASESIAQKTGCLACHAVDKRVIGKAYRDVAAKYRNNPAGGLIIRWKVRHGTGNNKPVPMPAFDEQALSDANLDAIIKWILNL